MKEVLLAATVLGGVQTSGHNYVPAKGYVPDATTATAIALAVATPVYGKAALSREQPLKTRLSGDTWTVMGTLPRNRHGGVVLVQISRRTGAILRMTHGK